MHLDYLQMCISRYRESNNMQNRLQRVMDNLGTKDSPLYNHMFGLPLHSLKKDQSKTYFGSKNRINYQAIFGEKNDEFLIFEKQKREDNTEKKQNSSLIRRIAAKKLLFL